MGGMAWGRRLPPGEMLAHEATTAGRAKEIQAMTQIVTETRDNRDLMIVKEKVRLGMISNHL